MPNRGTFRSRGPMPGSLRARKKVWAVSNATITSGAVSNDSGTVDVLSGLESAAGFDMVGATVLRLTGWLQHRGPAPHSFDVAIGVFPSGVDPTGDIGPSQNAFLNWMFYRRISVLLGTTANDTATAQTGYYNIDLAGRRKLDAVGDQLLLSWQQPGAAAGGFDFHLRILLALP